MRVVTRQSSCLLKAKFYAVEQIQPHLSNDLDEVFRLIARNPNSFTKSSLCVTTQSEIFVIDDASVVNQDVSTLNHLGDERKFQIFDCSRRRCRVSIPCDKTDIEPPPKRFVGLQWSLKVQRFKLPSAVWRHR